MRISSAKMTRKAPETHALVSGDPCFLRLGNISCTLPEAIRGSYALEKKGRDGDPAFPA